ncbi:2,3-bisphosphoglycerate-dependent phosphoglycerate mutase [Bartonella sp. TP]|uniref:2,3-bisphosphoglycerate-dependent phosphoglycerate mutase n=1 Tax=Bartonella sp. TP TaxID=3057550 RepID=UPI0025AEFB0D|nr:2,3-bisphosphoglycerate-dependent phosphoglycerate mutase [Bartonella sp. TP]MDN5249122.1 2,3-bisphosphoglycerate-dependent phosphoglycerate mutase [Alphaproteobacteria bacterium]WJW79670.1 2,3-bisphosphoglycerate-dependent phosphoglycerate mutase [Bartonella sp. TP]
MTRILVLVRHGQSEWNLKNLFTGWKNPPLTEQGIEEAKNAGKILAEHGIKFDIAFTSGLIRAQDSCKHILTEMNNKTIEIISDSALNERNYGTLSGLNKDEAKMKWGAEQVQIWRRSYDIAPPEGESLKDTSARVLPYYLHRIQPHLLNKQTTLITAHGNSLRALIMAIEGLNSQEIVKYELDTGKPIIYHINSDSTVHSIYKA